jgi:putative redox protein
MATVRTEYLGELRTKAVHVRSGNELLTDAPVDNKGRGEYFSPTDLLATSLGSCMITIAGMAAREHGFSIDGTKIDITKVMASNPRRVTEVIVELHFPGNQYTEKQKELIRVAVLNCPVAKSLHPDLKQSVKFNFR